MRKALIRVFILSYYFKFRGKLVEFSRMLALAMTTFAIGVLVDHWLAFIPFAIVNFIGLVYFKIRPVTDKEAENGTLTINQATAYFNIKAYRHGNPEYNDIADGLREDFNRRFKIQEASFSAYVEFAIIITYMIFLAILFLRYGSPI